MFGTILLAKTCDLYYYCCELILSIFWYLSLIIVLVAAVCKAAAVDDLSTVVAMPACDLGHWLVSWYSSCGSGGMATDDVS